MADWLVIGDLPGVRTSSIAISIAMVDVCIAIVGHLRNHPGMKNCQRLAKQSTCVPSCSNDVGLTSTVYGHGMRLFVP